MTLGRQLGTGAGYEVRVPVWVTQVLVASSWPFRRHTNLVSSNVLADRGTNQRLATPNHLGFASRLRGSRILTLFLRRLPHQVTGTGVTGLSQTTGPEGGCRAGGWPVPVPLVTSEHKADILPSMWHALREPLS